MTKLPRFDTARWYATLGSMFNRFRKTAATGALAVVTVSPFATGCGTAGAGAEKIGPQRTPASTEKSTPEPSALFAQAVRRGPVRPVFARDTPFGPGAEVPTKSAFITIDADGQPVVLMNFSDPQRPSRLSVTTKYSEPVVLQKASTSADGLQSLYEGPKGDLRNGGTVTISYGTQSMSSAEPLQPAPGCNARASLCDEAFRAFTARQRTTVISTFANDSGAISMRQDSATLWLKEFAASGPASIAATAVNDRGQTNEVSLVRVKDGLYTSNLPSATQSIRVEANDTTYEISRPLPLVDVPTPSL